MAWEGGCYACELFVPLSEGIQIEIGDSDYDIAGRIVSQQYNWPT
jgi:hypothetical protein